MTTKTAGQLAIERALSETESLYELVFCIPSYGFAMFSKQRKRFVAAEHACEYARISADNKPAGMHFAMFKGTRAEVAAKANMHSYAELRDYTGDMADNPDDYKFALAIVGPDKKVASYEIDDERMVFVERKTAERALACLKTHCILPPLPSKQHSIEIVQIKGIQDTV